jgi:hypothetical protein
MQRLAVVEQHPLIAAISARWLRSVHESMAGLTIRRVNHVVGRHVKRLPGQDRAHYSDHCRFRLLCIKASLSRRTTSARLASREIR